MCYLIIFLIFPFLCFGNFDTFMGKETGLWNLVTSEQDLALLEKYKALYEKNRSHLDAPPLEWKIPKTIHFIWLGPKGFPAESVENIRSWMVQNPGWLVKFWTDRKRPLPCNGMQLHYVQDFPFMALKEEYEKAQNWGQKSDILRYEILYKEGGVYVDHDANCLLPFEPFHRAYHLYTCLELPHPSHVGKTITSGIGIVGASPGHPVLAKAIELVKTGWESKTLSFAGKAAHATLQETLSKTYLPFTWALEKLVDQEGMVDIVLPAAYFYAKPPLPTLYSKHFYGASWIEKPQQEDTTIQLQLSFFSKQLTGLFILSLLTIILLLGALYLLCRSKRSAALILPFLLGAIPSEASFESLSAQQECVKTAEDRENLALFMHRFESYTAPSQKKTIPKTLHFLWLGASDPSQEVVDNLRSWIDLHPDWNYILWSDTKRVLPHPKLSLRLLKTLRLTHLSSCYQKAAHLAERADLLRFEILFQEGGVFVDLGMRCLKKFDPLHERYDFYGALQAPHVPILSSSVAVSPRIIAAAVEHPLIKRSMELLAEEWEMIEGFYPGSTIENVKKRLVFHAQKALDTAVKEKDALALPPEYFFRVANIKPLFAEATLENPLLHAKTRKEHKAEAKWEHLKHKHRLMQRIHLALLLCAAALFIKVAYDRRRKAS